MESENWLLLSRIFNNLELFNKPRIPDSCTMNPVSSVHLKSELNIES